VEVDVDVDATSGTPFWGTSTVIDDSGSAVEVVMTEQPEEAELEVESSVTVMKIVSVTMTTLVCIARGLTFSCL